jgi:hypothetical protein
VLKDGASAGSVCDDGSRIVASSSAAAPNTAKISIFALMELVIQGGPRVITDNGALESPQRGKSSIKRSAISLESTCAHRPTGNRAINEANLCAAVSLGSSDSSAASSQGSTPSRASAERTLSAISFLSTPIGAKRKLSNSGLKKETDVAGVTMTTNHFASKSNK